MDHYADGHSNRHGNGHSNGHSNGFANRHSKPASSEIDIVVIGAGISGINAAYRIQTTLPSHSYTVLENRHELGGTWSLFRYPGIRSDSDLHTFGFPFNPWTKPNSIATADSIAEYLHQTVHKFDLDKNIRYKQKVLSADWSSEAQRWRLEVEDRNGEETSRYTIWSRFIIMGTGYYNYEKPLQADIPGLSNFEGKTVHPQFWPEHLDYEGKKMVVIGSGATAITILPAVVQGGVGSVTMLQRSPSYVMSMPQRKPGDPAPLYERLLPTWASQRITRLRHILLPILLFKFCRWFPTIAANLLRSEAKSHLPKDFPMDPHFKPAYNPWDQRLCLCPDADFFKCFESGRANIVTAKIKSVVSDGIVLDNGDKIDADIIITATGLNLQVCGNIALSVDKKPVSLPDHYVWRTTMLSDIPNLGIIIGYVNASWTLGADATCRLLTRLITMMEKKGYTSATPRIRDEEKRDPQSVLDLKSTYIKEGAKHIPKAGSIGAWKPRANFVTDSWMADRADLTKSLEFGKVST